MLAHKLAQGLLYLYFINWLYKVQCSSTILFFPSLSITALDIRFPLITGFDNSRRSRFDKAMNKVPCTGYMEIYRHPDTQRNGPMLLYCKTFNIYRLGLVLAKFALWQPLVNIMRVKGTINRLSRVAGDI